MLKKGYFLAEKVTKLLGKLLADSYKKANLGLVQASYNINDYGQSC